MGSSFSYKFHGESESFSYIGSAQAGASGAAACAGTYIGVCQVALQPQVEHHVERTGGVVRAQGVRRTVVGKGA